jgi:energy-coupling factor transporter ATP-binding protein EcfA2
MNELQYRKGSEWRKWDLHVHTPASILNNGFGSNWDEYVKTLFKTLIEKEIAVVGITDYFTVDGYKKIKEEYLSNDIKLKELFSDQEIEKIKNILVIPNIEFRSDIFVGDSSVNFHIIFSEAVSIKDIEEKFLQEISFRHESEPNVADRLRKLTSVNLIELGAKLKGEHKDFEQYSDLYVGTMNAVVDDEKVSKILYDKKSIFGDKFLFITVADEDLSDIDWNSRDHQARKLFIQKSHFLFSSNAKTRSWGLGKTPYKDGPEKFVSEFKSIKPCLHGSDAHEYKFIANPCANRKDHKHDCLQNADLCELRYCWIKADPTFEGLKQVLYEPEDRVIIQEDNPTPTKSTQSIREFYIKGTTLESELKFKETKLLLNEGLVAVTGGKGGGKTALVDLIANIYEDRAFCDDKNSFVKRISENSNPKDLNTSIELQSGLKHEKEIKASSFIEGASIVYVAQGELEKHVEDPAHLERFINNLIFDSNEIKDSELLFDYQNINDEVVDLNEKISNSNNSIFTLENETEQKIEDELNKDGKKLETDLKDTEKKISDLAKSLSPEKVKEAEEKQKLLTDLRDKKTQLNDLGVTIKEALKFADENISAFNKEVVKINTFATKLNFDYKFKEIEYSDTENLRTLITTVREELRKTIGEIEKFQKDLEEKEKGIKEHAKLLDKKKELEKAIQLVKDKLKIVAEKKKILATESKTRSGLFEQLLLKRVEQRNKYLSIIAAFAQNKNDILNDLEFTAELIFDRNRFFETMSELVDLRKIKIKAVNDNDSEIAFFIGAMQDLVSDPNDEKVKTIVEVKVNELLKKIVPNQKKAETINRKTIYNSIFADYLTVMPSVKYKKVKLSKLSLGQKATVLIKIYLAQGENPIVIDSHDDHLDNEFIMDELVKALRQAKKHRQVIIVSNNGNVVVNSDAEQIIIACRDDQGEISYTPGSLENPALRSKLLRVLEGGEEAFSKRQQKYRLYA